MLRAVLHCVSVIMGLWTIGVVVADSDIVFDQLNIYTPNNKSIKLCQPSYVPIPADGLYWVSIAVDVPANSKVSWR
jgi:hypothetical protein